MKDLNRQIMEKVMGWKHGKPLKGGGCRPADAKPTPVVKEGSYKGCEMGSRGGTYPYFFHGTVFDSRGCAFTFKPAESLDNAMDALKQSKFKLRAILASGDGFLAAVVKPGWRRTGRGATPAEALCRAMLHKGVKV